MADETLVAIPDLHAPYHNVPALKEALKVIKELKPTYVVQLGDALDLYNLSRYDKDLDVDTPKNEFFRGRAAVADMWREVRAASPKTRCIQLTGNHEARLVKQVQAKLPQLLNIVDLTSASRYEGVVVPSKYGHPFNIKLNGEQITLHHGNFSRPGEHVRFFQRSTVFGHLHRAWTAYHNVHEKVLWELCAGFMADAAAKPLMYGEVFPKNWQTGIGIVDKHGPRFVALSNK